MTSCEDGRLIVALYSASQVQNRKSATDWRHGSSFFVWKHAPPNSLLCPCPPQPDKYGTWPFVNSEADLHTEYNLGRVVGLSKCVSNKLKSMNIYQSLCVCVSEGWCVSVYSSSVYVKCIHLCVCIYVCVCTHIRVTPCNYLLKRHSFKACVCGCMGVQLPCVQ